MIQKKKKRFYVMESSDTGTSEQFLMLYKIQTHLEQAANQSFLVLDMNDENVHHTLSVPGCFAISPQACTVLFLTSILICTI